MDRDAEIDARLKTGPTDQMVDAFMKVCNDNRATFEDINIGLIMLISEICAHHVPSEDRQNAYLVWLTAGVEHMLKAHGFRTVARPNPLQVVN